MRYAISVFALLAFCLGAAQAEAKSCSSFAVIKSFDAAKNTVVVEFAKGKQSKFFPKPEGAPADISKIPNACKSKQLKNKTLGVKPAGGRMSVTQVRSNFEGKMLNDVADSAWFASEIKKLVDAETEVVVILRPGPGKGPLEMTTIYLPITEEELAEIKRIEAQAEDT